MILNVLPRLTADDVVDCRLTHFKLFGQGFVFCSLFAQSSKLQNLIFAQCDIAVFFASGLSKSSLYCGINSVFLWRPCKQVKRINARSIIASMTHLKSFRDWSIAQFKRNSVRLLPPTLRHDPAVSTRSSGTRPFPAFDWLSNFYFCPKSFEHIYRVVDNGLIRFSSQFTGFFIRHLENYLSLKFLNQSLT